MTQGPPVKGTGATLVRVRYASPVLLRRLADEQIRKGSLFVATNEPRDVGSEIEVLLSVAGLEGSIRIRGLVAPPLPEDPSPGLRIEIRELDDVLGDIESFLLLAGAMLPDSAVQRGAQRIKMRLRFDSADELRELYEREIARGEMFLFAEDPRPPGAQVELELVGPRGGRGVTLIGDVTHTVYPEVDGEESPGMAVRLTNVTPALRAELEEMLLAEPRPAAPRATPPKPPPREPPSPLAEALTDDLDFEPAPPSSTPRPPSTFEFARPPQVDAGAPHQPPPIPHEPAAPSPPSEVAPPPAPLEATPPSPRPSSPPPLIASVAPASTPPLPSPSDFAFDVAWDDMQAAEPPPAAELPQPSAAAPNAPFAPTVDESPLAAPPSPEPPFFETEATQVGAPSAFPPPEVVVPQAPSPPFAVESAEAAAPVPPPDASLEGIFDVEMSDAVEAPILLSSEDEIDTDRRLSDRLFTRAQVKLRPVDLRQFRELYTRDISRGGVFVFSDAPSPIGTAVEVLLYVPGSEEPFAFEGRVIHIVRAEDARGPGALPGMGIRFEHIDEGARTSIEALISRVSEAIVAPPQESHILYAAPSSVAGPPQAIPAPSVAEPPMAAMPGFAATPMMQPAQAAAPLPVVAPTMPFAQVPPGYAPVAPIAGMPMMPVMGPMQTVVLPLDPAAAQAYLQAHLASQALYSGGAPALPLQAAPIPAAPTSATPSAPSMPAVAPQPPPERPLSVELRAHPRDPQRQQLIVRYYTLEAFRDAYRKDIARGGAFVPTDEAIPLRAVIEIVIYPPGSSRGLTLRAEVVHVVPADPFRPGSAGLGVQFVDLGPKQKEAIEAFLAGGGDGVLPAEEEDGRREPRKPKAAKPAGRQVVLAASPERRAAAERKTRLPPPQVTRLSPPSGFGAADRAGGAPSRSERMPSREPRPAPSEPAPPPRQAPERRAPTPVPPPSSAPPSVPPPSESFAPPPAFSLGDAFPSDTFFAAPTAAPREPAFAPPTKEPPAPTPPATWEDKFEETFGVIEFGDDVRAAETAAAPRSPTRPLPAPPPPEAGVPSYAQKKPKPAVQDELDRLLDLEFADEPGQPVDFENIEVVYEGNGHGGGSRKPGKPVATAPAAPAAQAAPGRGPAKGRTALSVADAQELLSSLEGALRKSYYDALGIRPNASRAQIDEAIEARMVPLREPSYTGVDPSAARVLGSARERLERVAATLRDPESRASYECTSGILLDLDEYEAGPEREARMKVRAQFRERFAQEFPDKVRKAEDYFRAAMDELRGGRKQAALEFVKLALAYFPLSDRYLELMRKLAPK